MNLDHFVYKLSKKNTKSKAFDYLINILQILFLCVQGVSMLKSGYFSWICIRMIYIFKLHPLAAIQNSYSWFVNSKTFIYLNDFCFQNFHKLSARGSTSKENFQGFAF